LNQNVIFAGIDLEKIQFSQLYKFMSKLNPSVVFLVNHPDFASKLDWENDENKLID